MSAEPEIIVLCGGVSEEREVSLVSGESAFRALESSFAGRVRKMILDATALPPGLDSDSCVVFPALHGRFGEDGELQSLLEESCVEYAGSDSSASRLCMSKAAARDAVSSVGVFVAPAVAASASSAPPAGELMALLGPDIVIKPVSQGSSVGLRVVSGDSEIEAALQSLEPGEWLFEQRVRGRELTIGLLDGEALSPVEIVPQGGVYDYQRKYTKGQTDYRAPAELPESVARSLRTAAMRAWSACGCRDFARADFILSREGELVFLEINTIPGLTPTSLLPKSAAASGIGFEELLRRMAAPALGRLNNRIHQL